MITPDPNAPHLKRKKSTAQRDYWRPPTFKIRKQVRWWGDNTKGVTGRYQVKAKQLAPALQAKKYLGGTDRKRKRSGSDEGAPSSRRSPPAVSRGATR